MVKVQGLPLGAPQVDGDAVRRAEADMLARLRERVANGFTLRTRELKQLRELEAKEAGKDVVSSLEALAVALSTSKRTVIRWHKTGKMPVRKDGLYDISEVRAWRARGFDGENVGDEPTEEGKEYWNAYNAKQSALFTEQKRLEHAGKLIDKDEVDRREARLLAICTAALKAFPRALPALLEGKTRLEMEEVIEDQVRSVIVRMQSSEARP